MITGTLGGSALLLVYHRLGSPALAAPLLATAILLLATGRTWASRRDLCERLGLASALLLTGIVAALVLARPWDLALLPILALVLIASVQAAGAYRFEPDFGQTGWVAACIPGLRRTLGPAFGLALVLPPALAWLSTDKTALGPGLLIAASATLGHVFQSGIKFAPRPETHRQTTCPRDYSEA